MVVYKPHGVGWLSCLSRWKGNAKARYGGISKECFSHVFFYVPTRTESIAIVLTFNAEAGRVVGEGFIMVVKREDLRTVSYRLEIVPFEFHPDGDVTDTPTVENDKEAEEREGLFHTWAEVLAWDAQAGQYYVDRVALIEDLHTGYLHEVKHQNFHFTDVLNGLS